MRKLNKVMAMLALLLVCAASPAYADSQFYPKPTDLEPGTTATLEFCLDNEVEFYGFQAKVILPPGLEVKELALNSQRADNSYRIESNNKEGWARLACFSSQTPQKPFSGTSGTLLNMTVAVADTYMGGTLTVSEIIFVGEGDSDVSLPESSAILGVLPVSVSVTPEAITLRKDQTASLASSIMPLYATVRTVEWKSSDESVVTVSQSGEIVSVGLGTADVTVTTANGKVATCAVTVEKTPVESISLSNLDLVMREGYTSELFAIVRPDDATYKDVVWSSTDPSVATVDDNGLVTAVGLGSAYIVVTSVDDPEIMNQCLVAVVDERGIVAVEGIAISHKTITLTEGDEFTLTATVTPDDATYDAVTWRSSDWAFATVSDQGVVTAVSAGTATIYASSSNGLTDECTVIVKPRKIEPDGISITNTELLMREGYSSDLIAIVRPDNAYDKTVVWATSDPTIAIVDDNGLVTAIKVGEAVITASTVNGITARCYVTVVPVIFEVTEVTLNKTSLQLMVDESQSIEATILPGYATDKTVTWKSLDNSIATVTQSGLVTGISEGVTTIYASSSNGLTVECTVTVVPGNGEPTGLSLSNTELLMPEGTTAELLAFVRPDNVSDSDKKVTWVSSDPSIATVDANGIVTAVKVGNATITATTVNGIEAICLVTVVPDLTVVESITLNRSELELTVGDIFTLIATVLPDNATDKTVTWRSSDRAIVIVSETGVVTAIAEGTATVYASSSNGLTVECLIKVNPREDLPEDILPNGISLTNTELLMLEGTTAELYAIVRPDNAFDKSVVWTTSDPSIATVDANGIVTAVKAGNATITATTVNGIEGYCFVTVVPVIVAVTDISLNRTELEMTVGDLYPLIATVLPEDATDKSVTWKSSNRDVATVSDTGVVTAVAEGTAIIYASSSNGLTAECFVTVYPLIIQPNGITLDRTELLLVESQHETLVATVTPDDATDKTVTWDSSDPSVATVDARGHVVAFKPGVTVVTASTSNGKTATCRVTVLERPFTPKQLLRKGDGTTSTFVIMMSIPDSELTQKGYRFVVGYTDSEGATHHIADTHLRYCHTTPEIFNDDSFDFWVYAYFENSDGLIVNSNLRHLDGREEIIFDKAISRSTGIGSISSDADGDIRISVTASALHVAANCQADMDLSVFNMTGVQMLSKSYPAGTVKDEIEFSLFAPGTYLVTARCGANVKSKKFVVR